MPGGDGTGPNGMGGWCTQFLKKGQMQRTAGFGRGFFERGRGRRARFFVGEPSYVSQDDTVTSLQEEAKYLEQRLNQINESIKKMRGD